MATIALACILKNELKNIPQLLESVKDCFDEIHLTDTGSTDGSLELIRALQETYPQPIHLHHFTWINDFAAARNASFEPVKTDYVMWMDLDDVLTNKEAFIDFRNTVMKSADYWAATYHYASDKLGHPTCSFVRERVLRTDLGFKWNYFVHEGVTPKSPIKKDVVCQYATSWSVTHKRDDEDVVADKSRNLNIFEKNKDKMDARMHYYYGKELFENGKPLDAISELLTGAGDLSLEHHDRVMGTQLAALCAMQLNQFEKAIELGYVGLRLDPLRAEFFVVIADSYVKLGKILEAVPNYLAATKCPNRANELFAGPLYAHKESYTTYPLNQLARAYAAMGDTKQALSYVTKSLELCDHEEAQGIKREILELENRAGLTIHVPSKIKRDEIVISCHPQGPYEWDEAIYKERGIGGSETAAVEMAYWLSKLTNREVLVFNNRTEKKSFGNVSYIPAQELPTYFAAHEPKVNISWRHNVKLTDADNYIWCHDLFAQGMERTDHYKKALALSNFHKNYLKTVMSIPDDKILVTSNGINPDRFKELNTHKTGNRLIWSSSPDRGIERALKAMDLIIKEVPDAELHCYYGFDNMLKLGKTEHVKNIKEMIDRRPYVKFHGNINQKELTQEMAKSKVWFYPTNFLETYCITAIEALCSKAFPIVREYGALEDTLSKAKQTGMAELLQIDCETDSEIRKYADSAINALISDSWKKVDVNPDDYSWEKVARQWVEFMGL